MKPEDLTTWALSEASPEDQATIEAQLKADPQLRGQADATKDFCYLLTENLGGSEETLTSDQKSALADQVVQPSRLHSKAKPNHFASVPCNSEEQGGGAQKPPQGEASTQQPAASWWRRPGTGILAAAAVVTLMGGLSLLQEGSTDLQLVEIASGPPTSQDLTEATDKAQSATSLGSRSGASDEYAIDLNMTPEVVSIDGFISYNKGANPGTQAPRGLAKSKPTTDPSNIAANSTGGRAQLAETSRFGSESTMVAAEQIDVAGSLRKKSAGPSPTAAPIQPAAGNDAIRAIALATVDPQQAVTTPDPSPQPMVATPTAPDTALALGRAPASSKPSAPRSKLVRTAEQPSDRPVIIAGSAVAPHTAATEAKKKSEVGKATDRLGLTLDAVSRRPGLKEVQDLTEEDLRRLKRERQRALEEAAPAPAAKPTNESYMPIHENPFQSVRREPLSTFSIDVDTASYANVRRFLNDGQRPPADAVRIEELVNYFSYDYEQPVDDTPFSVHVDLAEAPWNPTHRLARIGLKGREILKDRQPGNFVFLIDVSGSMNSQDKLPLVQKSLRLLARQLADEDRVAIVTYAGNSGLALESTPGADTRKILAAIDRMKSGGSTHGSAGIRLAYEQAVDHFIEGGINRVVLCTDGDFNVGVSDPTELETLITQKAKSGVFLSVLGFGTGNLKDRTMETLADKGNGNYAYIDSLGEARKVLVQQMNATLVTIAKDVKIQVEFNPAQVQSYRLIGYENRILAKEDFNDDTKDAGEIGAGHVVTALYELVPVGATLPDGRPLVDDLKYQEPTPAPKPAQGAGSSETMTVKLRYKAPDADNSNLLQVPVTDDESTLAAAPKDFQFASAVAGFGMMLRNSAHKGDLTWDMVRKLALQGKGRDKLGYRGEFIQLIDKAQGVTER